MNIAFFAPLKPADHPVPSGDRAMARALITALQEGGHSVTQASDLRLYDGQGDSAAQDALFAAAQAEVTRILSSPGVQDWHLWLTYHNYYKAPDLIGPKVAQALDIPYLQIESTRARKRLTGPWARFARAAESASDAAHTIFYLTLRDAETLRRDAPDGQHLRHLAPFLARADLPAASTLSGPMLSVGMMRHGDKLASYALIAQTLAALPETLDWHLDIAGDGPARSEVADLMAPFGTRVTLRGALDADALADLYACASLLLWPGVNEAFGLTYLEAQAAGIPVVAQDRPGVRDVVKGRMTSVEGGAAEMAAHILDLAQDASLRRAAGTQARTDIAAHHLRGAATKTLQQTLEALA
ncbi:glycosyltransferase family 4 protein [uncultured Tateyamaria sp.]|uniref:glycosyltransferase family 4 protein n=1 Tax=uncultured Tateyamaria sp. TaxID=455651 RepID=UPI00261EBA2D|nr:glycosyltransferase family 4 protein [uncultured Tateyamaria sp.]